MVFVMSFSGAFECCAGADEHRVKPTRNTQHLFMASGSARVWRGEQLLLPNKSSAHNTGMLDKHVRDGRGCVCSCQDRKSTRLNSSHLVISYAVFCLKKKKSNKK